MVSSNISELICFFFILTIFFSFKYSSLLKIKFFLKFFTSWYPLLKKMIAGSSIAHLKTRCDWLFEKSANIWNF